MAQGLPALVRATPLGGPVGLQLYAVKDSLAADPAATLRRVREIGFGEVETAGRFPMIHVKDFLPTPRAGGAAGEASEHRGAELGHGVIDYRPIFAAAEKAGLKHYFAEQEGLFTRMSELEAARQAYRYLRRLP